MEKDAFLIKGFGGRKVIDGDIAVGGAKNSALKLMAATLLFKDKTVLKNVPLIEDVRQMADLLRHTGAIVTETAANEYSFVAPARCNTKLSPEISGRLRASVVLTGPILARFGEVTFPHPGGCVIGKRPINLFLDGFRKMGAKVKRRHDTYFIKTPRGGFKGAPIFLENQSVTVTETFMMAGVLARGTTVISNAAMEPEVCDLADFLKKCGAKISGDGTPTIVIKGGGLLAARGRAHTVMPDRIEAGSFLVLGALAAKMLEIRKCNPLHLSSLIETLRFAGADIRTSKDRIVVSSVGFHKRLRAVDIKTHEYPGFPTDLQAPMAVFLTQANGESLVFETIFEGRLNYIESLVRMGARITMMDPHRVLVKGPSTLHGKVLESPDLRAGLAFVIAAIAAKGRSVVHNIYNIDRGYERIEERLRNIGVDITRISK